jgi:MFS family permease
MESELHALRTILEARLRAPVTGSRSRNPWRALQTRNYRLYFLAQLASYCGRWMQLIGQAWLVLDLTGSALDLGTLTVFQFAPVVVLSLFSGPLYDRFRTRPFLMVLQAAAVIQTAALAALVFGGHTELWQVYALAALGGTFNAIDNPIRQAFIPELVPAEDVQSAVGLNSTLLNLARVVGPAAGGIVIALWGTFWCFALNAIGYVLVLMVLAMLREDRLYSRTRLGRGALGSQVVAGLRYVWGDRSLFVLLALVGLIGGIGYSWPVTLPLLARYTFGTGATGLGALNAAIGAGSLMGGIVLASRPIPGGGQLAWAAMGFSLMLVAIGLAPTYPIQLLLLLMTGALGVFFSAGVQTVVQLQSRPEFRGRVLGLFFLFWAGGTPVGGALSGAIATVTDVRMALVVEGVLCVLGAAPVLAYVRRNAGTAAIMGDTVVAAGPR